MSSQNMSKGSPYSLEKTASEIADMLDRFDESAINGQNDSRDLEGQFAKMQEEIKSLDAENRMKQRLLKLQKQSNSTLEYRIKMMEKKVINYESRVKMYESSIDSKISEDPTVNSVVSDRVQELSDQNQLLKTQVQVLTQEKQNMTKMIKTLEEICEQKKVKVQEPMVDREKDQLQCQVELKDKKVKALEIQLSKVNQTLSSMIEKQKCVQEVIPDTSASDAQIELLEKNNQKLSEIINTQTQELSQGKIEINRFKNEVKKLEKELTQVKKSKDSLGRKCLDLQEQLNNQTQRDVSENFDLPFELNGDSVLKRSVSKNERGQDIFNEELWTLPIVNKRALESLVSHCKLIEDNPSKMSFLNMLMAWAEAKMENIYISIEAFEMTDD